MSGSFVIALDRSARHLDVDGRLHVELTNISKATVNPYYGREIPGARDLGLEPEKIYQILRDPSELAKAAPTFNNVPLLDEHVIVSVDDPKKQNVVGSTGTDAEFNGEYLRNSLVIWDAEAIRRIESGEQKQISCAYRYVAVKRGGTYKGLTYDLVMTSIAANHVALVREGRAGPDVVVADAKLGEVLMKFTPVKAKLAAKFAIDSALTTEDRQYLAVALDEMEEEVDAEDEEPDEEKSEKEARDRAKDKKAKDCAAKDKAAKDKKARDKKARDEESEEDRKEREAMDKKARDEDQDRAAEKAEDKKAMDAAIQTGIDNYAKARDALDRAKELVAPIVGAVHGLDSADKVLRFALDSAHIDHKAINETAALEAMVKMIPRAGSQPTSIAMDAKSRGEVVDIFPQLSRYA